MNEIMSATTAPWHARPAADAVPELDVQPHRGDSAAGADRALEASA